MLFFQQLPIVFSSLFADFTRITTTNRRSRQQIREALRSNDFLMNLDAVQLQEMVSCMYEQIIPAGCFIIREGDDGEHLYVGAGK